MINKNRMSSKMLEEYEAFEKEYPKRLSHAIGLYILGTVPLIIASAVATSNIIELAIERKKFKDGSR